MRMSGICSAVCVVALACTGALAQVEEDARMLLEESTKAVRSVESASFHTKQYGTGLIAALVNMEADVKLYKRPGMAMVYSVDGTSKEMQGETRLHFATDASTVVWVDHDKKAVFERLARDKSARDQSNLDTGERIVPDFWKSPNPYANELKGGNLTIEKEEKVGKVDCVVVLSQGEDKAVRWFIGKEDKLPRKWHQSVFQNDREILSWTREVTDLEVNPGFTLADFTIETPEGYVRDVAQNVRENEALTNTKAPQEVGLPPGSVAPDFVQEDIDGVNLSLSGMTGENAVVLYFWSSRFKNSVRPLTELQEIYDSMVSQNVEFVALSCRELSDESPRNQWINKGIGFPLILDADELTQAYRVPGFPCICIVGADGRVARFFQGYPGKAELTEAIGAALPRD